MAMSAPAGFDQSGRIVRLSIISVISALFTAHCLGQPISITDFRIPESSYQRMFGTLGGTWQQNASEFNHSSRNSANSHNTNVSADLNYVRSELSEDRSLEITADFNSNVRWNDDSNDDPSVPYHSSSSSKYSSFDLAPYIRYSIYFVPDTWFWFAQGQGAGHYERERDGFSQSDPWVNRSGTNYYKDRDYEVSAGVGLGFGKMRDGASVFSALRVIEKLEEDGVLKRSLTHEEILRLVDHLARQAEYIFSQDRWAKFLLRDIFSELERMDVLKTPDSYAYEVARVEEALYETIEQRLFGWRVAASVHHSASESDFETDQVATAVKDFQDYFELDGDYGYPVSLNTQLSGSFTATIPRKDFQRRIGVTLGARAAYQIGERIDASIGYTLDRSSVSLATDESENFERDLDHRVDVQFRFFIENDISFNVMGGYSYHKTETYVPDGQPWSNVYSTYFTNFGLRYRFF